MMMWINLTMIHCTTIKYHVELIYANKMFIKKKYYHYSSHTFTNEHMSKG
jgi:hypothetical protein